MRIEEILFKIINLLIIVMWVAGFFFPAPVRYSLWAFATGYGAGCSIAELVKFIIKIKQTRKYGKDS